MVWAARGTVVGRADWTDLADIGYCRTQDYGRRAITGFHSRSPTSAVSKYMWAGPIERAADIASDCMEKGGIGDNLGRV